MRLLLDTHALLWYLNDNVRLSDSARSVIGSTEHVGTSIVSLREIAIKELEMPASHAAVPYSLNSHGSRVNFILSILVALIFAAYCIFCDLVYGAIHAH